MAILTHLSDLRAFGRKDRDPELGKDVIFYWDKDAEGQLYLLVDGEVWLTFKLSKNEVLSMLRTLLKEW